MLDPADTPPPPGDEPKETADAGWLFREDDEEEAPPAPPVAPAVAPDESYEILGPPEAEGEESADAAPVPPVPDPPAGPARLRAKPEATKPTRSDTRPAAAVDRVWTRWGEWGPDIGRLIALGAATLFLLYLAVSGGQYALALLVFVAAGLAGVVLSYPLLITLERPVRIVPEQAVTDFYAALSHALPHHRRMWLLLSSAGRTSPHFTTFEGFRAYWNEQVAALAGPSAGRLNPLSFSIAEFQSAKSSGLTEIDVKFVINVFLKKRPARPVATYPVAMGLVKGPDRMWYLNQGTLPGGRRQPEDRP